MKPCSGLLKSGITFVLLSIFISCSSSSDSSGPCDGFLWTQEVQDEVTAFTEAGAAFGSDPTLEKCEIYKQTAREYVQALKGVNVSCIAEVNQQEYQHSLAEAEASVEEIDCSGAQGN